MENGDKTCTRCLEAKPLQAFGKASLGRIKPKCKACCATEHKERYSKDVDGYKTKGKRNQRLYTLKKHGLTQVDLDVLYIKQDSKCAICGRTEESEGGFLAIDHSHVDGRVRGLLCMACNTGLGNFKDDLVKLRSAIKYLEGFL